MRSVLRWTTRQRRRSIARTFRGNFYAAFWLPVARRWPRIGQPRHLTASHAARVCPATTDRASGSHWGRGGARGIAHISVLRMIEDLRIPIDCVAGTSVGALVEAMRASMSLPSSSRVGRWRLDVSSDIAVRARRWRFPER